MKMIRRLVCAVIFTLVLIETYFLYSYEFTPYRDINELNVSEGVWGIKKNAKPSGSIGFELLEGKSKYCCYGVLGSYSLYKGYSGKRVRVYWDNVSSYRTNLYTYFFNGRKAVEIRELDGSNKEIRVIISRKDQLRQQKLRAGQDYAIILFLLLMILLCLDYPKRKS